MKFFLGLLLCALSIGAAQQIGSEVPNFAMLDYKGRYHELRRADGKVVVLFFTSDGCPIARQSISRLKQIQKQFGPEGVLVWMVDSNTGDDRESIRREAQEF